MIPEILTEKHYIGRNLYGILRRAAVALFCFVAHFWQGAEASYTGSFFLVGSVVTVLSIVLAFIPYYSVTVSKSELEIRPLRGKIIRIPSKVILEASAPEEGFSSYDNPMFNVQDEGEYRFYVDCRKALLLSLEGGNIFRIGMKRNREAASLLCPSGKV